MSKRTIQSGRAVANLLELGGAPVEFPNRHFEFPIISQYKANLRSDDK